MNQIDQRCPPIHPLQPDRTAPPASSAGSIGAAGLTRDLILHVPAGTNITALLTGGIGAAGLTHDVLCAPSPIPYHGGCIVCIHENASACNRENAAALLKVTTSSTIVVVGTEGTSYLVYWLLLAP
jgi:hypothetical protein